MSVECALKTKLLLQECHFTWSLREGEDFVLCDLLNRLEEQIQLESDKPRVTRAYSSYGFVQYLYGNQQEALTSLQKSVQLAKEHYKDSDEALIVTYGDLAWLHYHMNEFSVCEDHLRQLERIQKKFSEESTYDVEVLREKGWSFLKFSHKYYSAAEECFRQALEMNQDDSDLNAGYAIALDRTTKQTSDSSDWLTIKQLKRAIQLNPDDAVLLVLLALRIQHNRHDRKVLETELKKVIIAALVMSPENPHVLRYAAKFCRQLGNNDMAIDLLENAVLESPNSAFIHHQLALCYKRQKIFLEKKHKTHGKAGFNDNVSYEIQTYLHKCIYHLEKVVSLKPSFVIAVADLALHYGYLGSFKAERTFGKAFELANNEKQHLPAVYCLYGEYQLYSRRSEQLAIYYFMQGLRLQPKSEQGKVCEQKLSKIIEHRTNKLENPNDSKVCGIQGFIHEVKGEKLKAEECYERALTNGLEFGESLLLTEMRIWLMSFRDPEKYILNLVFDEGSYEVGSGRTKFFKGSMNKKNVDLVHIDICKAKRILRWERLSPGPHAILLALYLQDFTDQTKALLEDLTFLEKKFWSHVIVVFKEGHVNEYSGTQRSILEWLLEKCGHRSYICGSEPEITERRELSERIQRMIWSNNAMHLVLPQISDEDSKFPSDDSSKIDTGYLFTPEVVIQEGQSKYRLRGSHAGWYHCEFTQIGFNMKTEGEVLYNTVLQNTNCPIPANHYQAGPVYDIKCVQGELSQLRLPHCETSIEDAYHFMSVIHYSKQSFDILKPLNITSTHVTVSITGTSKFLISKIVNWFKNQVSGQVMIFYKQQTHKMHVFLQPRSVEPGEVEKCDKDYIFIQTACECMLKYNCVYSMSCYSTEEHGLSERPVLQIQPQEASFCLTQQWKHFYPTFEIMLPDGVMNVSLQLKKKNIKKREIKVVWRLDLLRLRDYKAEKRRLIISTEQCASFLEKNKADLIQRVENVEVILDHLGDIMTDEQISEIRAMPTSQRKMRRIFAIIGKKGFLSKQKLYKLLYQIEQDLMEEMTASNN